MIRKYVLPLLAVLGFILAIYTVAVGAKPVIAAKPLADPARAPFEITIAGAGIVESKSQNIAVATPISGVVAEVGAQVGELVKAGAPLFKIDDRQHRALLHIREASLGAARIELARLESMPRAEDLPPAEARLSAAESLLADAKNQLQLAESLDDKRAIATQEWDRRRFAVLNAGARATEANAELLKLRAGAWKPDIEIARSKVESAEAEVEAARVEIDRLVVRAPIDATVLQVNVRKGEFAQANALATPLMLLGDLSALHVRVDIDENDVWRLKPGASAEACVRGNRELSTSLEFVRIDPYVLPKRSLTGESTERVDTRVLQVIYRFDPRKLPVFVGQQMDVFIEAPRMGETRSASAAGHPAPAAGRSAPAEGDPK